jgi:HD-GYP domain-containing protein (c-di-GMP phosphodiesterase class II)
MIPVARLVRASHERWDGTGYPDGLEAEEIPMGARIIAVCDAYDAMTSVRSYRQPVTKEEAVTELRRASGTQFDPTVVKACCAELGFEEEPEQDTPDTAPVSERLRSGLRRLR